MTFNTFASEKIESIARKFFDKKLEPKAGSTLSIASGILVDPKDPKIHEVTDSVSIVLVKELRFYKDTVVPYIRNLTEKFESEIKTKIESISVTTPNIKQVTIPEYIKVLLDRNAIIYNDSVSMSDINITLNRPDDISMYKVYGTGELESYVSDFMNNYTTEKIEMIWDKYIKHITLDNLEVFKLVNSDKTLKANLLEELFIVYVIVEALIEKPLEKSSMNLSAYENALKTYLRKLKNVIYRITEKYTKELNNGTVIVSTEENTINVIDVNFTKLAQSNIEVEVILGAFIEGVKKETIKQLTENAEPYAKKWNDFYSKEIVRHQNSIFKMYKLILTNMFTKEVEPFVNNPKLNVCKWTEEDLTEGINLYMSQMQEVNAENVKDIIKTFVIYNMFSCTNASSFFIYVDKYKSSPYNLDLSRSISFAMLELIVDFYTDEIAVCK